MVLPLGLEPRLTDYESATFTFKLREHKLVALEGIEPSRSRINGF
jgi:hypothetical protein